MPDQTNTDVREQEATQADAATTDSTKETSPKPTAQQDAPAPVTDNEGDEAQPTPTTDDEPASESASPEEGGDTTEVEATLAEKAANAVTGAASAAAETVTDAAQAAADAVTGGDSDDEGGEAVPAEDVPTDAQGNPQRLMAQTVEDAVSDLDVPDATAAGIDPTAQDELLTSVSAEDLDPTAGRYGYTGEITGRVIKLEDLERELATDEQADPFYDQLRNLVETTFHDVPEEEIVEGRVVSVSDKDVVIDIGFKSDGIVSKNEFTEELVAGDTVEVYLERKENWHGQVVLSKVKANEVRRWQRVEEVFENEEVIEGTIVRRIKGGMIVEIFDGMEAFLPGSQIDVRRVRDFDAYLERRMEFKIVKLNPANDNIVVSHRALIQEELDQQREQILSSLEVGQVLEGTVKNITDFGVFIDLGGVDGLLHITDLSWGRVSHPSELVDLDEQMNVVVLNYEEERQRISLGYKQLQPHPWEGITDRYDEGDTVEGKVVSITNYGAFVEVEKGIEGLVHISEMSWTDHVRHPSQMVALGQLVNVKILRINTEDQKISLGMKQLEPDPWTGLSDRYPAGTILTGKVRNITNFGVFVEIEPGIDGLVHISDLSWTRKVRHPGEIVDKGQDMDVVILNIDESRRRISLGHKQVETNPWNQFQKVYAEGTDHEARIVRVIDSGLVVELPLEVEGFVPASELKTTAQFDQQYQAGDDIELRVIRFDLQDRDIILSETAQERAAQYAERRAEKQERRQERQREQREVRGYQERSATGPATIGELSGLAGLRDQLATEEAAQREADITEEAQDTTVEGQSQEEQPASSAKAGGPSETPDIPEGAHADEPQTETGGDGTDELDASSMTTTDGDLEQNPGTGNRGQAGKAKEEGGNAGSNTEPAPERAQRQEDAGDVTPAEKSKAAQKPSGGPREGDDTASAAERETEDKTPSTGSGDRPQGSIESGQSPAEMESFVESGQGGVTTDEVKRRAQEDEDEDDES